MAVSSTLNEVDEGKNSAAKSAKKKSKLTKKKIEKQNKKDRLDEYALHSNEVEDGFNPQSDNLDGITSDKKIKKHVRKKKRKGTELPETTEVVVSTTPDDSNEAKNSDRKSDKKKDKSKGKKRYRANRKKVGAREYVPHSNEVGDVSKQQNGKSKSVSEIGNDATLLDDEDEVYQISSGDEDATMGMRIFRMAERLDFKKRHNLVVSLTLNGDNADYHQILNFLRRSRVHHILTRNPTIYTDYVMSFWRHGSYDGSVNPPVIRTTVAGQAVAFSREDLRVILQLGDVAIDNGPTEFPKLLRMNVLRRMGYRGSVESAIIKANLGWQWRYLAHVVVHVLSARKSGWDSINAQEMSIIVALVLNKPYSLSGYIFGVMENMVKGNLMHRFVLYPRFVAMILQHLLPDLPIGGDTFLVAPIYDRIFADCKKLKGMTLPNVPLFGHPLNVNYLPPPNNAWGHPDELEAEQQQQPQQQHPQPEQSGEERIDPEVAGPSVPAPESSDSDSDSDSTPPAPTKQIRLPSGRIAVVPSDSDSDSTPPAPTKQIRPLSGRIAVVRSEPVESSKRKRQVEEDEVYIPEEDEPSRKLLKKKDSAFSFVKPTGPTTTTSSTTPPPKEPQQPPPQQQPTSPQPASTSPSPQYSLSQRMIRMEKTTVRLGNRITSRTNEIMEEMAEMKKGFEEKLDQIQKSHEEELAKVMDYCRKLEKELAARGEKGLVCKTDAGIQTTGDDDDKDEDEPGEQIGSEPPSSSQLKEAASKVRLMISRFVGGSG